MSFVSVLLVALGGALGSVCRYLVGVGTGRLLGPDFPFGTMIVNIVGSFVMGLFIELLAVRFDGSESLRLFVAVGILGGFTTLSSFSLDSVVLFERGAIGAAALYVGGSIVLSLAALVAGLHFVRAFA
ncbi:Putative fluoride ion transporter CrcB [Pleomorphomonas sp. T1.2MG-36]|uniref:fluoride efflux transporter CrcB n=1 Tax=Pleomorphomonas sp. T1.2MG-36 TaxID=3041167 RepID=UPI002477A998|nr:fluoride efflux transporter CrcB [Pleomorphomonas sp. T1.2MG-36]CAI9401896.1 Putative fluoride ion transporter CrcB [Pleomorphomonas sp. T1.2MG-36]